MTLPPRPQKKRLCLPPNARGVPANLPAAGVCPRRRRPVSNTDVVREAGMTTTATTGILRARGRALFERTRAEPASARTCAMCTSPRCSRPPRWTAPPTWPPCGRSWRLFRDDDIVCAPARRVYAVGFRPEAAHAGGTRIVNRPTTSSR